MNFKNILEKSKQIIQHLPIEEVNLDLGMEEKDSQIVVTLPHFTNLDEDTNWAKLSKSFSHKQSNCLYVHIPFCTGICTYCSYVRKKEIDIVKYDRYLDALEKECQMQVDSFGMKPILQSIYIGGGTPSILTIEQLSRLFEIIKSNYQFKKDIEYTLEGCPETIESDKIDIAWKYGVNRVSLGVESFNDEILKNVNRRHRKIDTLQKLEQIRKSKIKDLDIDLINNLPLSTLKTTYDDAITAVGTKIPSVTLYHFHNKPKSITKKTVDDPKQYEQILKHIIFDNVMKENNFIQDNYDKYIHKKGSVFEHQVQKWSQQINMLTLGVGCYGFINNTQFYMTKSLSQYYKDLENNRIPLIKSKTLAPQQAMLRNFIMDIKIASTNFDINQLENKEDVFKNSEKLINLDLIGFEKNHLVIKEKGKFFVDYIQRYFHKKLWQL